MKDASTDGRANICVILLTAPPHGSAIDNAAMIKVDGREAALRCMEMFTNRPGVVQIILVVPADDADEIKRKIGSHLMFMGVKLVVGRATWIEQLADAHKAVKPEAEHVLVHDAARPAVPYTDLDRIFAEAGNYPAVALGRAVKGTLAASKSLPGPAEFASFAVAEVMSPVLYDHATFAAIATSGALPNAVQLIEGSPLNARCGWRDTNYIKAMIGLLPKPKAKAPISPFEEAQW